MKKVFIFITFVLLVVAAKAQPVIVNGVLTSWKDATGKVVIPDGVTAIGSRVFNNNTNITEVVVPNSVTSIGTEAFNGCYNLTSISGLNSVKSLSGYTFNGCFKLKTLSLPALVSLDYQEFGGCGGLVSLELGTLDAMDRQLVVRPLLSIGSVKLQSITVSSSSSKYKTVDGVLFSKDMRILIFFPEGKIGATYTIPNSVVTIGSGSFVRVQANVVIPNSVTMIEGGAFADSKFTSIEIPSVVGNNIGEAAFQGSLITTIKLPESMTIIPKKLFFDCKNLATINIPNITSIKDQAFEGTKSLKNINLPNTLKDIGYSAFQGSGLTTIVIPNSIYDRVHKSAFSMCKELTSVKLPENMWLLEEDVFSYCERLERVTIPAGVERISSRAFWGSGLKEVVFSPNGKLREIGHRVFDGTKLTSVVIPNTVTSIGSYAFYGTPLTSVKLSNILETIDVRAFEGTLIESIELPSTLKVIGHYAFLNTPLKSLIIPNSVTYLGMFSFGYCIKLEAVTAPASVVTIESSAFEGCKALKSATVLNGEISFRQFHGCTNLESVTASENLTTIRGRIFDYCQNIKVLDLSRSINLKEVDNKIGEGGGFTPGLLTVYVPNETVKKLFGETPPYKVVVKSGVLFKDLKYSVTDNNVNLTAISSVTSGSIGVKETGFVYALKEHPTIADKKAISTPSAIGALSATFKAEPNTTYYVKAFVTDDKGITTYSTDQIKFSITTVPLPAGFPPILSSIADIVKVGVPVPLVVNGDLQKVFDKGVWSIDGKTLTGSLWTPDKAGVYILKITSPDRLASIEKKVVVTE